MNEEETKMRAKQERKSFLFDEMKTKKKHFVVVNLGKCSLKF